MAVSNILLRRTKLNKWGLTYECTLYVHTYIRSPINIVHVFASTKSLHVYSYVTTYF